MTEQEIIDYLKQNREKGVTFDFMPNEVKHWCNVHRNKKIFYIYYSCGWRGEESCIDCRGDGVYCLSKDYAKFKTDWQEFDIDEDGCFKFEDKKYYYREDARFETENRDKFKGFGGWLFNNKIWCTNPQVITHIFQEDDSISDFVSKDETCEPAFPTKIRFWRYRE